MAKNILNLDDFDQIYPDSVDPVWSEAFEQDIRVPNSNAVNEQGEDLTPALHVSNLTSTPFSEAQSAMGNRITHSAVSPLVDLEDALERLERAAQQAGNEPLFDTRAAQDALDILLGRTQGRFYDGFPLLNYNTSADENAQFPEGRIPGDYKMKVIERTGKTQKSPIDGKDHEVWGVTVNVIWYGQNFDADTFLLQIPPDAKPEDTLEIRWRVYSIIQEDLAPTTMLNDATGARIFHGLDSTFISLSPNHLSELTVSYPSLKNLRGIYNWGWGLHPPRIQFIQPVSRMKENGIEDEDGSGRQWDPISYSFVKRNRDLTLDKIGNAAPEKKAYQVAKAAQECETGSAIASMLADPNTLPRGSYRQWMNLASNQRHLPDEAWDKIKDEPGVDPIDGKLGPYDAVIAYMNNELYGLSAAAPVNTEGRKGSAFRDFEQGSISKIKAINLDNHTHYYRNVDFGAQVVRSIKETFTNGKFSFEKFNVKPTYGVPKVAEMQWRTGWGYVPHRGVLQQSAVFPRQRDQEQLRPFTDQLGQTKQGYQFTETANGFFRFNPPPKIREGFGPGNDPLNPDRSSSGIEAGDPLKDWDGQEGICVGQDTEGFGVAKMPNVSPKKEFQHPNPQIQQNLPDKYPDFLRNCENTQGGDIIPPTPAWKPFLAIHPKTGKLENPDCNPSNGMEYWVDKTYQHGRPIPANSVIEANVEAPRASAQLFYQFDPLFHDNAIFSFHPSSDIPR